VEGALALGIGTGYYWAFRDRNVADWDNPSARARLSGEAWRYDNNALPVNYVLHPLTGAGAYLLARANHLSVPAAFAYSFAASFAWEYVIEFKEKVSINDVLVTPAAGLAIGEFFHKLGRYLDSTPEPGVLQSSLSWSLGLSVRAHRGLDGADVPRDWPRDNLGLASGLWHEFELGYLCYSARSTAVDEFVMHRYGFDGTLVSLPRYLQPGFFDLFFYRADLTSLQMAFEYSRHGPGLLMLADTFLLGSHMQRISRTRRGPHGYAATVGTNVAARYLRSGVADFDEQLGVLHLPGFALDWHALAPGVALRVRARANPDFVGAGASAYADWQAANRGQRGKSILRKQGYFHGWGGSAGADGRLRVGPLELRGRVLYGWYDSQEGLDRAPEIVTAEVSASTRHLSYQAALLLAPEAVPVAVGLAAEGRRYRSRVAEFTRDDSLVMRGLQVAVTF
jgi:hypothetical protein